MGGFSRLRRLLHSSRRTPLGVALLLAMLAAASAWAGQWDRVKYVVDGDTVELRELGRTRLIGIDTPEVQSPYREEGFMGEEASQFARKLLAGREVRVAFEGARRDRYDRLLAYLYLADGRLFNLLILEEGLAYFEPRYEFQMAERFQEAERAARLGGKGIWSRRPGSAGFHGNTRSRVYHAPGCRHYECSHCRRTLASHPDAAEAGYRPHYQCIRSPDW